MILKKKYTGLLWRVTENQFILLKMDKWRGKSAMNPASYVNCTTEKQRVNEGTHLFIKAFFQLVTEKERLG